MTMEDVQRRIHMAHRSVSAGNSDEALREARKLLAESSNREPAIRFNCAGILVDAGERLDDAKAVREGTEIFQELFDDRTSRAQFGDDLRYNLANGRASLIHMPRRRASAPDYRMRDLSIEEQVVGLYYDASDRLTAATPEVAINCASMLRAEERQYEAIDVLDGVLAAHPTHPNCHLQLGNALWTVGMVCRARDGRPESLFVAALWHLHQAQALFDANKEPESARLAAVSARRLTEFIPEAIGVDPHAALNDIGDRRLGNGARAGLPLGMTLLARSPYRDEDDPWLLECVAAEARQFLTDAVGTYAVARTLLTKFNPEMVQMPRWDVDTPQGGDHVLYAAVRQLWSVFEKTAWILNAQLQLDLKDNECHFARVFAPPSEATKKRFGIPIGSSVLRHPNLERDNPGLLALSGIAHALRDHGVYEPLKRLRHAVEHRSPSPPISRNDAAFLLGIARAAVLHTVDALQWEQFRQLEK